MDGDPRGGLGDSLDLGAGKHLDAFFLQNLADCLRDILVFARNQPRAALDDRHLRAEAAIHLGEFQPDITAAQHDQMVGQAVQRHHVAVGEVGSFCQPRQIGDGGAPADIEEDPGRGDRLIADLEDFGCLEAGMAGHHRAALHAAQPFFDSAARLHRHLAGAGGDFLHIDGNIARRDAEIGAAAGQMGGIGAGHQRLGRHAAGIDAGAAEIFAFDQAHGFTGAGQAAGQGRSRLAGADDDGVEALHGRAPAGITCGRIRKGTRRAARPRRPSSRSGWRWRCRHARRTDRGRCACG